MTDRTIMTTAQELSRFRSELIRGGFTTDDASRIVMHHLVNGEPFSLESDPEFRADRDNLVTA